MNAPLLEGLALLHLQPGQSLTVQLNGEFEIRRLHPEPPPEEKSEFEDMVMLQPWCDFPDPEPSRTIRLRRAPLPLPDPPDIPPDDDASE